MWPARPPARRRTSSAAANRRSAGPSSSVGSRLPCTARSWPTTRPRLVERLPPVERRSTSPPASARSGRIAVGADAEVDQRHAGVAQRGEDAARVRQRELAVVAAAERAGPRVEDLQRLRRRPRPAPAGSRPSSSANRSQRRCHARGLRVHERLGPRVGGRRSAFDRVRRQRERRAAEADERHAAVELACGASGSSRARAPSACRGSKRRSRSTSAAVRIGIARSTVLRPSRNRSRAPSA